MNYQIKFYKPVMETKDVAELLGFSTKTIYEMVANGELRGTYRKLSKSYRFSFRKILEYIEKGDDELEIVEEIEGEIGEEKREQEE